MFAREPYLVIVTDFSNRDPFVSFWTIFMFGLWTAMAPEADMYMDEDYNIYGNNFGINDSSDKNYSSIGSELVVDNDSHPSSNEQIHNNNTLYGDDNASFLRDVGRCNQMTPVENDSDNETIATKDDCFTQGRQGQKEQFENLWQGDDDETRAAATTTTTPEKDSDAEDTPIDPTPKTEKRLLSVLQVFPPPPQQDLIPLWIMSSTQCRKGYRGRSCTRKSCRCSSRDGEGWHEIRS